MQTSRCLATSGVGRRLLASSSSSSRSPPRNEPTLDYKQADSEHRRLLQRQLDLLQSEPSEVPILIGGKEFRSDQVREQRCPFDHRRTLARFYYAPPELIEEAARAAVEAQAKWRRVPMEQRLRIFESAADRLRGPSSEWRAKLNAATMLGQAKTIRQAEIDSACELADFFAFNSHYGRRLLEPAGWHQPISPQPELEVNQMNYARGLDGFVAAISPFNFTAIGANLVNAPALMGNSVVWKPSDSAVLANYLTLRLLHECGLPADLCNFVPSHGLDFGRTIGQQSQLAGVNFTGSLATFQWLWAEVGLNIKRYRSFPRLVGECGGKNFHLLHESAHLETAFAQTIRSAFEYSGQKCSACSRLFVPARMWAANKEKFLHMLQRHVTVGPATDFSVFTSAVIDANSYAKLGRYFDYAKRLAAPSGGSSALKPELDILCGAKGDDQLGYFIEPTVIETRNPASRLMSDELFGPVLTVYPYAESEIERVFELLHGSSYALTGAVFAQDEQFLSEATTRLQMAAGNFYINDKSTGAVVGQQPFGGSRLSGTNDKAGGPFHLLRWCNQQTIKRTKRPLTEISS